MSQIFCANCDNEAVGYFVSNHGCNKGKRVHLCQSCGDVFEWGQENKDAAFALFDDDEAEQAEVSLC